MYYRPREKKRNLLATFILATLLVVMLMVLTGLVAIYIGYFQVEVPTLASRFEPTPTPTRPAILYVADGDNYFSQGKLNEAITAYDQAIRIDSSNDVPYIRQSRLLVYTRDMAKAVEQAAQAVILKPNSPENLAYYCRALDWEARYSEAYDACSCAIELDPTYAESYAFLSEVYADQGNWIAARTTAQQAIDTNFQSMDAHHNMGYALEVQGRYVEAAEFYENAIKLAPNLGPLYVDAGQAHYSVGNYEMAADRFKKAIRLNPTDPVAYDRLGWTYYTTGEYALAIDALEQSIGVDPNYVTNRGASTWGHLALVYYARQNFEKAIEFFPRAIELAENEFLRRARRVEIYTEIQTLTGPASIPVLQGRFAQSANPADLNYIAELQPVTYAANRDFDSDQSCADVMAQSIQNETVLLSTTALTFTQVFSQATGVAILNSTTDNLFLDLNRLPQPQTRPYEIRVTFWPNRTDSVGYFQPEANQQAQVNIKFEEKLSAPIEYYYGLGLAYAYLDRNLCDKAIPWLLKSLEIDSSGYNPAWYGLRQDLCPTSNTPPTPIPTFTPVPEVEGQ